MPKAVLVDVTKCIGCRSCQVACKQWNELPAESTRFTGGTNPADLSATTWSHVRFNEIAREDDSTVWRYVKTQCMHCADPACVSVCPVGALEKTAEGPVVYDHEKCIGCRYCLVACPWGVPSFEWNEPLALMRKCSMCADRIGAGLEPACVTACPTDALIFGDRDELLAVAADRIAAEPAKYVNHIYGKQEAGGTSWLYISDVPFDEVGLPTDVVQQPLPSFTAPAMHKVPWIIAVGSLLLSGLTFYTHRRAQLQGERRE